MSARYLILAFLLCICGQLFAQFSLETNSPTSRFDIGENIQFIVTSPNSGIADYILKYDNHANLIKTGSVNVTAGVPAIINHTHNEAGHIQCVVTKNNQSVTTSAAIGCFDIEPLEPAPSDFKQFWNDQITLLGNVPMDPQLTFHSETGYSKSYKINLGNIDNRRVYGLITIPNGSGPFPAVLVMPSYGVDPSTIQPENSFAEYSNAITAVISIHNTDVDEVVVDAYTPDDYADREANYYRYGLLGGVRAIDYFHSRNDFDQTNVAVYGVSQGGGLSILMAGIDDRVDICMNSISVLCENAGLKYDRASGFPSYINKSRNENGSAAHEAATVNATKYYDAVHAATHFDGPVLMNISYLDEVTPPATMFAAYNQFKGNNKVLYHSVKLGHNNPEEYWLDRFKILRKFWPQATANPPWPWVAPTTGYFAEAGDDLNIASGSTASLNGVIEVDGNTNTSWPVQWEQVEGPGTVIFSNQNNRNTTASFSADGIYLLKISAHDNNTYSNKDVFVTAEDYITVNVGVGNQPVLQNQTITFPSIADKLTTDIPFNIGAAASSNLPVSFSIVSGPATLVGNQITLTGQIGTVVVEASQPGNNQFHPAPKALQSFDVESQFTVQNQTITFPSIADKLITDTPFIVGASASSNLPISFSIVSGPATIAGNLISLTGQIGTVVVEASQPGNMQFNPAPIVLQSFDVSQNTPPIGGCSTTTNIAANKVSTQSGTQVNASADRANDGNTDGNFWGTNSVTFTNWVTNSWWEVDLGAVHQIEEINIWNRTDCCTSTLSDFHILISDTPFNSTNLNTTLNQQGVSSYFIDEVAGTPTTELINLTGQFVRIQLDGTAALALAEVEIMGCISGGTSCTTAGQSCDDLDDCTSNDIYDSNCNCIGTFEDADNDTVCDNNDICPGGDDTIDTNGNGIPDFCDTPNCIVGNPCDDLDDCTTNDQYDLNCNCVGTFEDTDNDGVCDTNDICPGGDDNIDTDADGTPDFCDNSNCIVGNPCDDLDDCTFNDAYDINCNCVGTFDDADNDGICDADDCAPNNPGLPAAPNSSCDDSDSNTTNDIIQADGCTCEGTPASGCNITVTSNAGIIKITGLTGNNINTKIFTTSWTEVWGCNPWFGTPCNNVEIISGLNIGETYYVSVQSSLCSFFEIVTIADGTCPDADNDSVCDADDICPGGDDLIDTDGDGTPDFCDNSNCIVGNSCDDLDPATTNDIYDSNCNCAGTISSIYCGSSGASTDYEYIEKVIVSNVDNTSGNNNGYADFTSMVANVTEGTTTLVRLTPGFTGSIGFVYWRIWIDLNQDGDFLDAGEQVHQRRSQFTVQKFLAIPSSTLTGPTRMRISMNAESYAEPCDAFSFGEVEDYTINILPANSPFIQPEIPASTSFDFVTRPNPVDDYLTVEFDQATKANQSQYFIYNGQGILIETKTLDEFIEEKRFNIKTSALENGYYVLVIQINGIVKSTPFIKLGR